jgi:hypothetical protein
VKQQGDVSGTGDQPVETNMTERLRINRTTAGDRRPRRTLRTTTPCSHCSAIGFIFHEQMEKNRKMFTD